MPNSRKHDVEGTFPDFRAIRRPTSPGDVLREEILDANKLTQDELADAMQVSRYSVNQLVNGKRNITAEMAIRLSAATSTSPKFWLDLQRAVELFDAWKKLEGESKKIKVILPAK
jgi:addiction module HigA family antidote